VPTSSPPSRSSSRRDSGVLEGQNQYEPLPNKAEVLTR
jgi:hypothetical protein